jgi:hypothetical protein
MTSLLRFSLSLNTQEKWIPKIIKTATTGLFSSRQLGCKTRYGGLNIINGYPQMTVLDYLLKFRKISSLETLEKLYDHLNYSLTNNEEIINMYRAADHRRAELVSGGRLYDVGQVPKSVWRFVQ